MCLLVVVIYSSLAAYEFLPLIKEKDKKGFLVNSIFFILSFTIAMLLCLGFKIPSPSKAIEEVITSIFGK